MTSARLAELCRAFRRQRIVVVGDVMLDHYIRGDVRRISPEAPVPVVEHHEEHCRPGGAANVARNLASLGAKVRLVGLVGADREAVALKQALAGDGIVAGGLVTDATRPTTVKTRILAGHQQLVRVDRESRASLGTGPRRKLVAALRRSVRGAAAIIVADYAKGAVDQAVMDFILVLGRRHGVPVCIDPKPVRRLRMQGCALLTPNRKEAFELAGMPDEPVRGKPAQHAGLKRAITAIRRAQAPRELLVTLGEGGMLLVGEGSPPRHLPTTARAVYDISGAGDTVIAAYTLARVSGAEAIEAATVANLAAGIVVGKLGTAAVSPEELVGVGEGAGR